MAHDLVVVIRAPIRAGAPEDPPIRASTEPPQGVILASVQLHLLLLARAYRDDGKADNANSGKPERDFQPRHQLLPVQVQKSS
jgi:hypothetical protein